jgi:hypothetical protein
MEANLSYFEQGTGLISQAVASIRAIVEIDQAQCDRNVTVDTNKVISNQSF